MARARGMGEDNRGEMEASGAAREGRWRSERTDRGRENAFSFSESSKQAVRTNFIK